MRKLDDGMSSVARVWIRPIGSEPLPSRVNFLINPGSCDLTILKSCTVNIRLDAICCSQYFTMRIKATTRRTIETKLRGHITKVWNVF